MIEVTTESGSVYQLFTAERVWVQVKRGNVATPLRTSCGKYFSLCGPKMGERMLLTCPPLNEGTTLRLIETTPVTRIVA